MADNGGSTENNKGNGTGADSTYDPGHSETGKKNVKSSNNKSDSNSKKKLRVFIGSSVKGLGIAKVAGKLLESEGNIEVTVWDKLFKIGETYIERLAKSLEEYDFAVLVITGEDFVTSVGGTTQARPRDNVLFELGLFMGRLGRYRAIMLYDEKQKANLPTDLGGIHRAQFSITDEEKMTDEELKMALEEVHKVIQPGEVTEEELKKLQQAFKAACKEIKSKKMTEEELTKLQQAFKAACKEIKSKKMTEEELTKLKQVLEDICKKIKSKKMKDDELKNLQQTLDVVRKEIPPGEMTDEELKKLVQALEPPCNEIRKYILNPYEEDFEVFKVWKDNCHLLYKALEKAEKNATIKIIQTWFPDVEDFIINLKKLLTEENKRFKLQILLMNDKKKGSKEPGKTEPPNVTEKNPPSSYPEKPEPPKEAEKTEKPSESSAILEARILHRFESGEVARMKIQDTIWQLVKLKITVEEIWKKEDEKKKDKPTKFEELDLEIHKYDFLPFGPFYQIGEKVMFVGFYLNSCSSIHAPMLKIKDTAREPWNKFSEHFKTGWDNSREVNLLEIETKIKEQNKKPNDK